MSIRNDGQRSINRDQTAACICIGGKVVSAGPKVLTWECSRCGRRRRRRRDQVTVIRV